MKIYRKEDSMRYIRTQDKESIIPILGDNQNFIFWEEVDGDAVIYYGLPCDSQLWLGTYSSKEIAIDMIDYIYQEINAENSAITMPKYR